MDVDVFVLGRLLEYRGLTLRYTAESHTLFTSGDGDRNHTVDLWVANLDDAQLMNVRRALMRSGALLHGIPGGPYVVRFCLGYGLVTLGTNHEAMRWSFASRLPTPAELDRLQIEEVLENA